MVLTIYNIYLSVWYVAISEGFGLPMSFHWIEEMKNVKIFIWFPQVNFIIQGLIQAFLGTERLESSWMSTWNIDIYEMTKAKIPLFALSVTVQFALTHPITFSYPMSVMASQITGNSTVLSIAGSLMHQIKHQSSAVLALRAGNPRHDAIMVQTNRACPQNDRKDSCFIVVFLLWFAAPISSTFILLVLGQSYDLRSKPGEYG